MNKYFVDNYITSGMTRDNMLFCNCNEKLISFAKSRLGEDNNDVISCLIEFTQYEYEKICKALGKMDNGYRVDILARDYIISRIMEAILIKVKGNKVGDFSLSGIRASQSAVFSGDFRKISEFISSAPMPLDLEKTIREVGRVEINFFLENFDSVPLQKAINNFLSSRTPYSVKVFTNKNRLVTYYDQLGNLIQSPHDYMLININNFINDNNMQDGMQTDN